MRLVGVVEVGQTDEVGNDDPCKKHSTFQSSEARNVFFFFRRPTIVAHMRTSTVSVSAMIGDGQGS